MRVGMGYDVHRLAENRKLVLGGVEIPHTAGLLGHSDADVAVHAVMDALLGAAALGDIGKHFPDTDEKYAGISSLKLLAHVGRLLEKEQYVIENIDVTIVAQKPKLRDYISQMEQNIADILCLQKNQINIKATTEEGLGFTGTQQGISAYAVCAVQSLYDGSFTAADSAQDLCTSDADTQKNCPQHSCCHGCGKKQEGLSGI